jgi:hypothetical protein
MLTSRIGRLVCSVCYFRVVEYFEHDCIALQKRVNIISYYVQLLLLLLLASLPIRVCMKNTKSEIGG